MEPQIIDYAYNASVLEYCNHPELMLDDGVPYYNHKTGYCGIHWPAFVTLDLKSIHSIGEISFLLWDYQDTYNYSPEKDKMNDMKYAYRLLISEDMKTWSVVHDTESRHVKGWQYFRFTNKISAQYVRIHALHNERNSGFHIVKIHVLSDTTTKDEQGDVHEITNTKFESEVGDLYPLSKKLLDLSYRIYKCLPKDEQGVITDENLRRKYVDIQDSLYKYSHELNTVEGKTDELKRLIIVPISETFERLFNDNNKSLRKGLWVSIITILIWITTIIISSYGTELFLLFS